MKMKYLRGISFLMALTVFITQSNITAVAGDAADGEDLDLADADDEITWEEGEDWNVFREEDSDEESGDIYQNEDDITYTGKAANEAVVISEIEECRDEYSKEYILSDDSRAVFYYDEPVHYEDEEGSWKEIDNSLVATNEGYENADNAYHVLFTDSDESQGEVVFEEDGYTVDFEYVDDINDQDDFLSSSLIAEQSDPGMDLFSFNDENEDKKLKVSLSLDEGSFNATENKECSEDSIGDSVNESNADPEPYIIPSATVTYEGYENDVALEYSPSSSGVKENIILKSSDSGNSFSFRVRLEGLKARISSANEVELYDEETNEIKYYFPAPFMEDSEGRYSDKVVYSISDTAPVDSNKGADKDKAEPTSENDEDDISIEVEDAPVTENSGDESEKDLVTSETEETPNETEETILEENIAEDTEEELLLDETKDIDETAATDACDDDFIYLTLTADEDFLSSAQYPVVIDPVINKYEKDRKAVSACYASDENNTTKTDSTTLYVGKKNNVSYTTCIWFELPYISPGAVITDAKLYLNGKASDTNKNYIVAKRITSAWNDGDTPGEAMPSIDTKVIDYTVTGGYFNITKPVREWVYEQSDNYGLAFMTYDEDFGKQDSIKLQKGNKKPFLKITFRNTYGLESYWSTHDASAGTAGKASINDYTGTLTVVNTSVHTEGLRMPFNIQNIYNSNLEEGKRWTLNYDQRIVIPSDELDVSVYPYIYIDEDQTRHYFKAKNISYLENGVKATASKDGAYPAAEDEDGLKLYIVPVKDKTLKDTYPLKLINKSSSTVKYFDKNGCLALITDSNKYENGKNPKNKNNKEIERERNEIALTLEAYGEVTEDLSGFDELTESLSRIKELSGGKEKLKTISDAIESEIINGISITDSLCSGARAKTDIRIATKLQNIKKKLQQQKLYLSEGKRSNLISSAGNAVKAANEIKALAEEMIPQEYHITSVTDAVGNRSELSYDEQDRLLSVTDPRHDGKNKYSYNDGDITRIEYLKEEGGSCLKEAVYNYEDGFLCSMQDDSGYSINFTHAGGRIVQVSEARGGKTGQTYSINYGNNSTVTYRFSGKNDCYGDGDDVFNTEVFDEKGRVVSVYSQNSKGEVIGANAVTYTDGVKHYAKTSFDDQRPSKAVNLIDNSGFEDERDFWIIPEGCSENVNLHADDKVYLGKKAARINICKEDKAAFFYQTKEVPAGTYTISYVIHTSGEVDGGAVIYQEYCMEPEKGQTFSRYEEDDFKRFWTTYTFDNDTKIYIYMCAVGDGTAWFDNIQLEKGSKPTSYSSTETTSSSAAQDDAEADEGVRNKVKDNAVSGRPTHNYLLNHSFERKGLWEGDGVFDSAKAPYIGKYALNFNASKLDGQKTAETQTISNLKSGSYTFSCYAKGINLNDAKGWLSVRDGNEELAVSSAISETTSKKIGDGWERLSVSFDLKHESDVTVCINAKRTGDKPSGALVFDCAQLENGDLANDYNILEDGNFDNPDGSLPDEWKNFKNVKYSDEIIKDGIDGDNCYHIKGEPGKDKYLKCSVDLGKKTASYIFSGFVRTDTTPIRTNRVLTVEAYHKSDAQVLKSTLELDDYSEGWKYFTLILPAHQWGKTEFSINFYDNIGDIYIDGLQLSKVNIQSKKYDSSGRVLGVCVSEKQTAYGYDTYGRMNKKVTPGGVTYKYNYDSTNNNTSVKASVGPSAHMTYDKYGNQKTVSTHVDITRDEEGNATNKPLELHTSCSYSDDGNYLSSKTDESGEVTYYEYDSNRGFLLSEEQPGYDTCYCIEDYDLGFIESVKNKIDYWLTGDVKKRITVNYEYGKDDRITGVTKTDGSATRTVSYKYKNDSDLESIEHNGFTYGYEYDDFGNVIATTIAGIPIQTNNYGDNNGSLKSTTYADGRTTTTKSDEYGNISEVRSTLEGTEDHVDSYRYYNDGNLAVHRDEYTGFETNFAYGDTGKVTDSAVTGSKEGIDCYSRLWYIYNTLGKVENLNEEIKEGNSRQIKSYVYTYAKDGNNAKNIFPDNSFKKYGYDSLRRLKATEYSPREKAVVSKRLFTHVGYKKAEASSKSYTGTQNRVETYANTIGKSPKTIDSCFTYDYDDRGNITGIQEEYNVPYSRTVAIIEPTRTYNYDAFGQVVRAKEEYKDGTVKYYYYTYDAGGNIISELVHDNDKNEDDTGEYVYDAVWRDKLISYNGNEIIYDDCGNPKKYLGYDMSWDTSSGSLCMVSNSDHSYEYSYFSDGQRLSKDVDGKKTVYIYNAGMLLAQETDEYRLNFYYDADGLVTEIGYQEKENGEYSKETYYFYTRNGQGDIIGIYRCSDSTLVGTYEYDLWGNPVSKTENVFTTTIKKKEVTIRDEQGILDKNPLRYRGYYYDEETGFYYLNARYYNPKVHRFISADSQIAGVSSDVNGFNLFAYCDNDPVNKIDDSGMWPQMSNEQKIGCGLAIVATIALAAGIAAIAPELGISACALQTVFIAAVAGQAFCSVAIGAISAGIAYMNGADADEIWQAAYDSAADAFLGGTIIGGAVAAIAGGIGATACFLAGTPVNAENGKVPIENVKPGDMVLSEDPETGDVEYKRVLEVYINESTELVHLIIEDEEIITTPSHPFYVKNLGFVPAGELSEHSVLVDSEGNELHLQTVRWEHLQSPIPVYNFAVEDYHTYFVGNIEVLVHNMCEMLPGMNELLKEGYHCYREEIGVDCSEIADYYFRKAGNIGEIYRIEGTNGQLIRCMEYGSVEEYLYHEVYSYGGYIFDPRYSDSPVLKADYFRILSGLNPNGFHVFTK